MDVEGVLADEFHRQHGLITRQQFLAAGLTARQLEHRVRRGVLQRVEHQVYRHYVWPESWHNRLLALCLSSGAVASHRSAGHLLGLFERSEPYVEISHPRWRRRPRSDVRVHETTQFRLVDRSRVEGIPCTGIGRTVIDLAAVVGPRELDHVVDAALRLKLIDWPGLYRTLVNHSRQGRDGAGKLRRLLDRRYGEEAIPDSRWNRLVAHLLESEGLPTPDLEYSVRDRQQRFVARLDLAYPSRRLGIELDSVRWHHNIEAFHGDRSKRNRLLDLGWKVLAFTWEDYREQPQTLARQVRAVLAQRAIA